MQPNINPVDKNSREYLVKTVAAGRYAVLMVMIFTVVNLVLLLLDRRQLLLFSASVPYYLTLFARAMDNGFSPTGWHVTGRCTFFAMAVSVVILTAYLICWLQCMGKRGFLTAALVMFSADTLALVLLELFLGGNLLNDVFEFFLHGWAIWQMAAGVHAHTKLRQLPKQNDPGL